MKKKLKVMTIVGTRPELIKLSRTIAALDENSNHILVHTGQNFDFELNEIFFKELKIRKPNYFLNAAGANAAITIGNIISKIDKILEDESPDAILLYGDTNSCLAVISAKRRKIPIFHAEAGNRCFDQRVPEEINRKIVDHLSDVNIVHSEHARRYLISEGLSPDRIFKFGSPMNEIFNEFMAQIDKSNILSELKLKKKDYFLISAHREENIDNPENFKKLLNSLNSLAKDYGKRIIVSTHPRTRKKLESIKGEIARFDKKIEFLKPLGFFGYNKLQKNALCVLSDSGTITEESSIINFPAVMIRQAHERPEGMDKVAVVMSDLAYESIGRSVDLVINDGTRNESIEDYNSVNFSQKMVRLIYSYTDFINRVVWKK